MNQPWQWWVFGLWWWLLRNICWPMACTNLAQSHAYRHMSHLTRLATYACKDFEFITCVLHDTIYFHVYIFLNEMTYAYTLSSSFCLSCYLCTIYISGTHLFIPSCWLHYIDRATLLMTNYGMVMMYEHQTCCHPLLSCKRLRLECNQLRSNI